MKELFKQWLKKLGKTTSAENYSASIESLAMDMATANTNRWPGIFEYLIGKKPEKAPFAVANLEEFRQIYGQFLLLIDAKQKQYWSFDQARYDKCFRYTHVNAPGTDHRRLFNALNAYRLFLAWKEFHDNGVAEDTASVSVSDNRCRQKIVYGAPGTGKSRGVNDTASKLPKENVIRTTFHPDSDYSTFVGTYKPKMDVVPLTRIDGDEIKKVAKGDAALLTEKRLSYEFVPQAFAKAYVQAWKKMAVPEADGKVAPVMLVIEEINRGDCAKIFGDLFQLLDRRATDDDQNPNDPLKKVGFSEYPVLADSDLADYIRRELEDVRGALAGAGYDVVAADGDLRLVLPPNMYIWATMNTSDQSLFPMDSAFKRRWDWKYVPIEDKGKGWRIKVGADAYKWWSFLEQINDVIAEYTSSEDKQLGYFFAQPGDGGTVIDAETFVSKVIFYLWKDVFRDDLPQGEPFKYKFKKGGTEGEREIRFTDFYQGDLRDELVGHFLEKLGVEKAATEQPGATEGEAQAETPETETAATDGASS